MPDEDVIGFEVAMNYTFAVGGGEAAAGGEEEGEDVAPGAFGAAAEAVAEGFADHQFHRDVDLVCEGADVVDGDDVGVREASHQLGLAVEAFFGAAEVLGAQELKGDVAIELGIVGGVDDAHAAGADDAANDVAPNDFARFQPETLPG